jgi:hypothetical protein
MDVEAGPLGPALLPTVAKMGEVNERGERGVPRSPQLSREEFSFPQIHHYS